MKDIFIVGAGGFGREIAWTLSRINALTPTWNILGFADDAPNKQSGLLDGYPLLGDVACTATRFPSASVFIAIGDNATRAKVYRQLQGRDFPTLIDPSALIAPTATLGPGVFVGPQSLVSLGAQLGAFVIVNARAGVGHDAILEDFAHVCPGVTISGNTHIGTHALLGSNASTVPGIEIGDHAKIAAGLPVYHNVAAGATLSPFGMFR